MPELLRGIYQTEDLEAELSLIETLIYEEVARKEFVNKMFTGLFTPPQTLVFNAIKRLHNIGQPVDLLSLSIELRGKLSELDLVNIVGKAARIVDRETFSYRFEHLKTLYFLRFARHTQEMMERAAMSSQLTGILSAAARLQSVHSKLFSPQDKTNGVFDSAVGVINSPIEFVPCSFPILRGLMGGWSRGDMSAIGGKPGQNKTTFTLYDAKESLRQGLCNKILYVSVDEPASMVARRIIADEMDISLKAMRDKKIELSNEEVEKVVASAYKGKLFIMDNLFTCEAIAEAILDLNPDRTIVDHIQECDYGDEGISDQKVTVGMKKLKFAAKTTKSNVTVLSQVRDKQVDERYEDRIPRPHDFLYGSDLRRKAREQAVVYWEYKDTEEPAHINFFQVVVYKSTYSDTGRAHFIIDPDKARFFEKKRDITKTVKTTGEVPPKPTETPEQTWEWVKNI